LGLGMTEFAVVLTTFPADRDPAEFARTLVEEQLAACVNVLPPMVSTYCWKDAIETADERQIIIKTTRARLEELRERIDVLHPYDVPEFVVLAITEGSPAYLTWLAENTRR